ncbi:Crossover junction endonuclease mus81 [Phytophthora pseudosyringae]|uniref:Crossover junction endonuclease MUS81 n=1 Tax=Phytophthora pseudosyringae TaxID=221518 RepID=A0A8T1W1G2_9STRA|nr:Crossover junction endonuclease mus81 [Phytophthora pseudosyringae]
MQRSAQGCAHAGNDPLVEDLLALKQRVRESSHLASNYGRAIASVRAHATPLRSASEAKTLRHIGNYLSNQIHGILRKRGLLETPESGASNAPPATSVARVQAEQSTRDSSIGTLDRSTKDYVPAYRKQPWFVLLALQEAQAVDEDAAVSNDALLRSMLDAGYEGDSGKLRTCLASLSGTHEVVKRSNLGFYYLTEKGRHSAVLCPGSLTGEPTSTTTGPVPTVAATATAGSIDGVRRKQTSTTGAGRQRPSSPDWTFGELEDSGEEILSELNGRMPEPEPEAVKRKRSAPEDLIRETDSWELVLLLDHREVIERRNPRILERKLLEQNVNCEVRALGVGDVQWIARRGRNGGEMQEFILNVIVERKEVHDLSGSIIDRRFFEQKTRLATVRENCGDVHVIYLIEGSLTQITTVRTNGLHTAMGRTQVQNNFFVQQCQNADETVTFLSRVYARLLAKFPPNPRAARPATSHLLPPGRFDTDEFAQIFCLPPQAFAPFNSQFRKKTQFTVREIFQRMLLQAPGLSAAKTVEASEEITKIITRKPQLINQKDEIGSTPLRLAVDRGNTAIAAALLDQGADMTAGGDYGSTMFHVAAKSGNKEMVAVLLERGADMTAKDAYGSTTLHIAVGSGNVEMAEMLISAGADIAATEEDGSSALHIAVDSGSPKMVCLLLDRRANVDAVEEDGRTALHIAARFKNTNIAKILLNKGASVTAVTKRLVVTAFMKMKMQRR